ncbi:MAG: helix-turn-helix transcriptional regulator [Bacillota bacterium]
MHRIGWFDQQIRAGSYPNSSDIAKQFEISKRQAARDIEYMQISLRAPLVYAAKHRGYCYEDETFVLPYVYMTEEEKRVLKYLAHRYRHYNYDNAEAVNRVAHLLDRFTEAEEGGQGERLPVFQANPRMIQQMELLSHAIQESLMVRLTYRDQDGERQLQVCPIKFISRYHADYVTVQGENDDRPISLRLDGIQQLTVTDLKFKRSKDAGTVGYEGQQPVRTPFIAKVQLQSPLYTDSWNGYPVRAHEQLVYEIEFYDTESFLQHLLIAEWQELLSPEWLKQKLHSRCGHILDRLSLKDN